MKLFQSQNGLILVYIASSWRWNLWGFQSQNGLILVKNVDYTMKKKKPISIPKWSDFSTASLVCFPACLAISIPKWSDFSLHYYHQSPGLHLISIPKWSDFSPATKAGRSFTSTSISIPKWSDFSTISRTGMSQD